jgi:hypothetical protein
MFPGADPDESGLDPHYCRGLRVGLVGAITSTWEWPWVVLTYTGHVIKSVPGFRAARDRAKFEKFLEIIAHVDFREFEKLKSVHCQSWVSECKAKENEVYHAKRVEHLVSQQTVAPPDPSKLPDFGELGA